MKNGGRHLVKRDLRKKLKEGEEKNSEEKEKEEKSGNIVRKKNKYKLTIKPSYITIEKKDNSKKKVVDSSQFSNEYKSEELFNWIPICL